MNAETTKKKAVHVTAYLPVEVVAQIDALVDETGASRHAVAVLALSRGIGLLTADDARTTLPGNRAKRRAT